MQSGHRADTDVYERSAVSAIGRWAPTRKARFYEVLSTAALALIVIGVMVIVLNRPIKDDVAWLLYVGKEVLHGRQLYVDLIEINPPLIVFISALAVWVSNLIGVHATAFYLITFGGVLLGLAWFTSHILRHYFSMSRLHRYSFAFIGSVFFVIPGAEFGQREHLLLALLSPYLALLATRLHGGKCSVQTAFIAGILCGLGLALKPQYLLAVLILESWLWVRGVRWFRPETLALAAALFAYGASIALLFPAYFTDVVPLAARLYGAGDASPIRMFFNARQLIAPLAIAFIVLAARLWRWRQEPLVDVLLLFGLSAFAIYFLQNKGWAYHRLPADAAFTFLFAYWLIVIIASSPAHQTKAASFAIAGTAVALGFLGAAILEKQKTDIESVVHYDDSAENWLTKLIQRQGTHSIMAFSQVLSPVFPVMNDTGIRWTSRFGSMWALKAEESAPPRKGPSIRQQVIDDFVTSRPDLVLVSDADNFDYLEKLGRDATFEEIWRRYVFLEGAQGMRVFGSPELAKSLAEPIR